MHWLDDATLAVLVKADNGSVLRIYGAAGVLAEAGIPGSPGQDAKIIPTLAIGGFAVHSVEVNGARTILFYDSSLNLLEYTTGNFNADSLDFMLEWCTGIETKTTEEENKIGRRQEIYILAPPGGEPLRLPYTALATSLKVRKALVYNHQIPTLPPAQQDSTIKVLSINCTTTKQHVMLEIAIYG